MKNKDSGWIAALVFTIFWAANAAYDTYSAKYGWLILDVPALLISIGTLAKMSFAPDEKGASEDAPDQKPR